MISQVPSIVGYEWILGLGLCFGLSFLLTMITEKSSLGFLVYFVMFNAFVVWADLLELYTLVASFTVLIIVIFIRLRNRSRGVV